MEDTKIIDFKKRKAEMRTPEALQVVQEFLDCPDRATKEAVLRTLKVPESAWFSLLKM